MRLSRLFRLAAICAFLTTTCSVIAQSEADRQTTKPLAPPSMEFDTATEDSSEKDIPTESDSQPIQLALNFDAGRLLEEVRVTGTYIRGVLQEDLPTPLSSIDRDAIRDIGAFKPADLINNLTINTGSENNTDAFTQNFTTGTSNINLRGLGVASTLVLLNSRRQTYSAFTTDNGENFVDTSSLVPMIAIDRIEILKDGAASLYGSDAVGGVVNFITRNNFKGAEISLDYLTGSGTQQDSTLSAIFGTGSETLHFMAAVSLFERDGLSTSDRRLSGPEDDLSNAGFPGSYILQSTPIGADPLTQGVWTFAFDNFTAGATPTTPPTPGGDGIADYFQNVSSFLPPEIAALIQLPVMSDPNCAAVEDSDSTTFAPETFPAGLCQFDFGGFYSVVPEEERTQLYSSFSAHLSETLKFEAEIALANNEAQRDNSPSFPITSLPGVPAYHPNNPYGIDVAFIGRTLGSGGQSMVTAHTSDTMRLMAALQGQFGKTWTWTADISLSSNEFSLSAEDTLAAEFQLALAGLGGANCSGNPADIGNPGAGCFFFNPFAAAPPATANANSVDIIDYVTGNFLLQAEAELTTYGAVFSGELFKLKGGAAAIAFGLQYRDETLDYDYDNNANNNNYLFFVGNPDFNASRDAVALFGELSMPFADTFMMQLSLRAEDYGDSIDSVDPKIAALWRPAESVGIRASVGTSFRAPSIFQSQGIQTSLEEITTLAGTQFIPVRARADLADPLLPEEADVYNLGITWNIDSMAISQTSLSVDYWSYDYDQVIIQQNAQAVHDAAFAGNIQAIDQIDFADDIVSPLTIERIRTYYDNASSLQTNGIDILFTQNWDTDSVGNFLLALELTKVLEYDLEDPQSGSVDGLGSRNFANFGTSTPELRGVLQMGWGTTAHTVNLYARHIDSYMDDQNSNANIASHTTFDVQYRYSFAAASNNKDGVSIAVGGINVTDEEPPYVATNGGFDSKVHDPRGALYYIDFAVPF